MENLLREIGKKCPINVELKERIQSDFKLVETKKKEILLEQGNIANHLYFIEKGVLHNYYFFKNKKVSSWFYAENRFVSSWYSFFSQKQSYEEIECLEDCVLYKISYQDYQKLIKDFPAFNNFARLLSEEIIVFFGEFSKGWAFLTAKEKYDLLLSYSPTIELRIKLGFIASFIGVSQETLSRIRAGK
ncbi:Crp/Fnr family transcriptional regulator [Aureivirga marina]|uniref:Crp/Fnr family transcriptional regulator n=1 Tax=Aureivirga marina TaxID=1182451 RepID=UPI0018C8E879|nr:Crp/Fnr family transcriptional regulator [Aureivirga marina]